MTGDEPFYLLTAQSLVSDGDLDLTDEYRRPEAEMARFWDGTKPLWKQMEPAPDGRLLSPHDPGLSLLISPAYAAGGLEGVRRFLVFVWAAALGFAAVLARRAGAPRWASVAGAVAAGAGAPGLVYASQVYPEGPAALCISAGLVLAGGAFPARPDARGAPDARNPSVWRSGHPAASARRSAGIASTAGIVLVVVALEWQGVKYLPFAAAIAGIWAWNNRRRPGQLAAAGAVAAAAGVHFVWWHLDTFGGLTPYSTNVVWAGEGTSAILRDHLSIGDRTYRLYGVHLDERFGLLRWLPAAAIAFIGISRRTWPHAATLAIATLLATFVSITIMGYWFPGRMLIAALPSLAVLIAVGATRLPKIATALIAWSLTIAAAVAVAARTGAIRLAVDPWTLGPPLPPSFLFPDFRDFAPEQILKSAAWAAAALVALGVAGGRCRVARREGPAQGGTHEVGGSPVWEGP